MATGNTQVGYGTTLKWNSYTVAKLTKIGGASFKTQEVDIATLDAANRALVTKPGMIKYQPIPVEGVLATDDTTGQMALYTDGQAATSRTFIITLPTTLGTVTVTGTAFLSEVGLGDITPEGYITIKFNITPTGAWTWSSAA